MDEHEQMFRNKTFRLFNDTEKAVKEFITRNPGRFENESHLIRSMINHSLHCEGFK